MVPDGRLKRAWVHVAAAGLIACTLSSSCALAANQQRTEDNQAHSTDGAHGVQADEPGSKQNPVVVTFTESPKSEQEAADVAAAAKGQLVVSQRLLEVTAVLAIAAALQWFLMLIQTRHFGKAAAAALKSAEVAERALVGVERPILLVGVERSVIVVEQVGENLETREVTLAVKNIGRQPAVNDRCVSEIVTRRKPFEVPKPGVTPFTSNFCVGLDLGQLIAREQPEKFECRLTLDGKVDPRDAINRFSIALYLFGVIEYSDAIGTEREHGFTFAYVPQGPPEGHWRRFIEPGYNFDRLKPQKKTGYQS